VSTSLSTHPPTLLAILAPLGALLLAVGILFLGQGILFTLVPIWLSANGASAQVTGLVGAAYFAGMALGARYGVATLHQVGHIRAFAGFVALVAVVVLTLPLLPNPWLWVGLRFLHGYAIACAVMAVETWLTVTAPHLWRGQTLATYTIMLYAALGAGQFFFNAFAPDDMALFNICAICFALSVIPVALSRLTAPLLDPPVERRLGELFAVSPLGLVGSFSAGLLVGAFFGLTPLFGERIGLTTTEIAWLMATTIFGGLGLNWPLGWLSDNIDRRTVMLGVSALTAASSLAVVSLPLTEPWTLFVLLALFGGTIFALYSLSLAHAADFLAEGDDVVSLSSGLLLVYGSGAAAGPLLAGQLLDLAEGRGLFLFMAIVSALFTGYGLWRVTQRSAVPVTEQSSYVAVPRSTPVVLALDPRIEKPQAELDLTLAPEVAADPAPVVLALDPQVEKPRTELDLTLAPEVVADLAPVDAPKS